MNPFLLNIIKKTQTLESTPSNAPIIVSSIEKVQNYINENREQEGKDDALAGAITIEEGVNAIKEKVKQLCDKEIKGIERELIGVDEQITTFEDLGHTVNAAECKIHKKQKEEEIKQIKEKMGDINENLPIVASYKKGFKEGEVIKIKAMLTKK